MKQKRKWILLTLALVVLVLSAGLVFCRINTPKSSALKTQASKTITKDISVSESQAPITDSSMGYFTRAERKILFDLIHKTLQDGLDGKKPTYPDLENFPEKWREKKAVYVTLNINDKLRGCQGTKDPVLPFIHAVIDSTYRAGFEDPRFPKLTQEEFNEPLFNAYISVFGEKRRLSFKNEQDLIKQLKPFQYGAILSYQDGEKLKQGLFLPSVWKKRTDPKDFWKGLKKKAHIKKNFWSDSFIVDYFPSDNIRDIDMIKILDQKRIQQALTAFKKLFREDGSIIYYVDFKKGKLADKNNLVREMGSGYGLAYAYYSTKDETLKPLLVNFLDYAKRISVVDGNKALVADEKGTIKSGATALLLLAELYYEQASQDKSFVDMREKWKNGLVALYEKGQGIHTSPTNNKTSPYYDGETWLALAVYNEFYPQDKQVSDLMPELNQLMYDKYGEKYIYNFFHWGTQAAAKQYQVNKSPLMYEYLQKQLNLYLNETNIRAVAANCSYAEGLSEALIALKGTEDKALYERVMIRLENQLEVPRLLQKVPYTKPKKVASEAKPYLGLFFQWPTDWKPRNDTTQHCMISLLKAQKVFDEME